MCDMKRKKYFCLLTCISLCVGAILISGCSPSESSVQTAIYETDAAKPTLMVKLTSFTSYTKTPTLTKTATKSMTPTIANTSTETQIPPKEMTQAAILGTQTARAVESTSTQRAYEINLTTTASARPSLITFLEVEGNYYDMEDEQWNSYRSSLKGEIIQWTGKILDKTFDTLLLDMGQYAPDRMVALHKVPTVTVDGLKVGNTVSFIATITDVTFYCDVQLNFTEMK